MAAQWRLLTEYLNRAGDDVQLAWIELDSIVGGLPASAIDHHPQWWHGDRPNTRAWRAAGYETIEIQPGFSVRFTRSGPVTRATVMEASHRLVRPTVNTTVASLDTLRDLDPTRCLVVIPCSASKRKGGRPGTATSANADLSAARRTVLNMPDSRTEESLLMPAWQRYDGHLYRAVGPDLLSDLAASDRLVILSGGYGVLDGRDLIGYYERLMKTRDWPTGLLERAVTKRPAQSGLDVVAFAGTTTAYAKVLRHAPWKVAEGRTSLLVTIQDRRGLCAISTALGVALRAFLSGSGDYPAGAVVERLGG